jgi:hypothetical protein
MSTDASLPSIPGTAVSLVEDNTSLKRSIPTPTRPCRSNCVQIDERPLVAVEAKTAIVSEADPRHVSNRTNNSVRHPAMIGMPSAARCVLVSGSSSKFHRVGAFVSESESLPIGIIHPGQQAPKRRLTRGSQRTLVHISPLEATRQKFGISSPGFTIFDGWSVGSSLNLGGRGTHAGIHDGKTTAQQPWYR